MIKTKADLKEYIRADLANNYLGKYKIFDATRKYLICLRKTEYFLNTHKKIRYLLCKLKFKHLSDKFLTYIPLNAFEKGLSIGHFGCIFVHPSCRAGVNCRIHETVNIGATNGEDQAAVLGDNVFIGSGAKIIGNVKIASDVAIGASAVVVKDIDEPGITVGGVPAKKISNNNSHSNIKVLRNIDQI